MTNEEKDLKKGDENSAASDQGGENQGKGEGNEGGDDAGKGDGNAEETVTIPKSEFEKQQSDLDNYRTATVNLKKGLNEDGTSRDGGNEEEEQGADKQVDESGKTEDVEVRISKSNQNRAKNAFEAKHPEFKDPSTQAAVLSYLRPSDGAITVEDHVDDLEDAFFTYLRKEDKLDDYLNSQNEGEKRRADAQAQADVGRNAGSSGDGKGSGTADNAVTDRGREIASKLNVKEEDLEKIDNDDPAHNKILQP